MGSPCIFEPYLSSQTGNSYTFYVYRYCDIFHSFFVTQSERVKEVKVTLNGESFTYPKELLERTRGFGNRLPIFGEFNDKKAVYQSVHLSQLAMVDFFITVTYEPAPSFPPRLTVLGEFSEPTTVREPLFHSSPEAGHYIHPCIY